MDLSLWNIPHLSKLRARTRDLRDFLGDVLEGERELLDSSPSESASGSQSLVEAFEVSSDWDELDRQFAILKPGTPPEKILAEFAPYFEGALCLKTERGQKEARLMGVTLFGRTFQPPQSGGGVVDLGLNGLRSGYVVAGRILPVLKALKIENIEDLHDCSAFAFVPTDGVIFVLFCDRPHPWQVFAIENAYLSARDACNRRPPQKVSGRGFFR